MSHVFGLASFVIAPAIKIGVSSQINMSCRIERLTKIFALPAARSLSDSPLVAVERRPKKRTAARIATYPDRRYRSFCRRDAVPTNRRQMGLKILKRKNQWRNRGIRDSFGKTA
tara:strand:- start:1583 stop:1924 length:342 start_codon:yes stop_codon:yes gene_type:complete